MSMQIITINLPEAYLDSIQILNDLKIYPSRSEVIRVALENFLSNELRFNQEIRDTEVTIMLLNELIKINNSRCEIN